MEYLIFSPAYKANGHHGTYYSIAFCKDNGDIIKIIGDHSKGWINNVFYSDNYTNIHQINGLHFSDADRFISIREIKINEKLLSEWENSYVLSKEAYIKWDNDHLKLTNGNAYSFLYDKKGKLIDENNNKYNQWLKENPRPDLVDAYGFLKAIINEN